MNNNDVTALEYEWCPFPTIFCKAKLQQLFIFIYVKFRFKLSSGKPSFIIRHSPPLAMQK